MVFGGSCGLAFNLYVTTEFIFLTDFPNLMCFLVVGVHFVVSVYMLDSVLAI